MADYTLAITVQRPYEEAVAAVRDELAGAGFGVLTEIDLRATLKTKLDVDVDVAALPCNVVVRSIDESTTLVEAFDPAMMTSFVEAPSETLQTVSQDARQRLGAALAALATGEGQA